jgi:hypothetical protein
MTASCLMFTRPEGLHTLKFPGNNSKYARWGIMGIYGMFAKECAIHEKKKSGKVQKRQTQKGSQGIPVGGSNATCSGDYRVPGRIGDNPTSHVRLEYLLKLHKKTCLYHKKVVKK